MLSVVTGVVSLFTCTPPGICAVKRATLALRLHQPVHRQHGGSGACRQLLLMYLGWEGVGLCSYLLIGSITPIRRMAQRQ